MEPSSFIRKYKIQKVIEVVKSSTAPVESTPKESFPVGSIRNGRKKVQMQPSKWVNVNTGHGYDNYDSPHDSFHSVDSHPELKAKKSQIMGSVKNHMRSDDLVHAEKMADKWLQEHLHYKNLFHATNIETSRMGQVPKDYQDRTYKSNDKAKQYKQEFVDFVIKAKKYNNFLCFLVFNIPTF